MRVPRSTPPPPHPDASTPIPASRLRRLAVLLAAGLLASLFAPWSTQTVTARGLAGPRRIRVSFSGWQALSPAAIACVAVALALAALLLVRSRTVIEGLGARGRRAARARIDGALVATGGLVTAGVLLVGLLGPPQPAVNVTGAIGSAGVRWGAGLALLLALGLVGLGLAIERAAALAGRRRGPATDRDRGAHRNPLSRWGASLHPRVGSGPAGGGLQPSARSQSVPDGELPMPEFDFAVGDGRRRTGERSGPPSPRHR